MLDTSQQLDIVQFIKETFTNYEKLNSEHRITLGDIYQEYRNFKQPKKNPWSSSFKINYAHTVVNKTLPRLIAKNPRWLVTTQKDHLDDNDKFLLGPARQKNLEKITTMAEGVQAYLTYIWDNYDLREPVRLWAKNMLIYGNAYAKIKFKYEVSRTKTKGKIEEKVTGEYPTIDVISWTNMYVDPRYTIFEDMPGVIELTERVRLSDLQKKKDKYINLDKLEYFPSQDEYNKNTQGSKMRIYEITGIPIADITNGINKNELCLKTFYGKYTLDGENERIYKFTTVNDYILIEHEEITCIPIEDIKCFDDTETHFATGMVEPILSLQEENNFKKNSASEYINNALNRSWIWSPNSGINPRDLVSKPNNIIPTTVDALSAMNNLVELPHRQLTSDYFQEQNDIERQIQNATFTIDTSTQKSEQALTNTATGIRVKFFESNSVIDELRKHLEQGLERLAYKLLQATYENMEDNIIIKKLGQEGFWEINKELLRDSLSRYDIKVEANSSSFDDVESRREDAIAFFNVLMQGASTGVQVNFTEALKDVINTFEKRDPNKFIQESPQMPMGGGGLMQGPIPQMNSASELTEAVAKGGLTQGL